MFNVHHILSKKCNKPEKSNEYLDMAFFIVLRPVQHISLISLTNILYTAVEKLQTSGLRLPCRQESLIIYGASVYTVRGTALLSLLTQAGALMSYSNTNPKSNGASEKNIFKCLMCFAFTSS